MVSAYEKRSVCLYRTLVWTLRRVDYTGEYKDRDWVWHLEPGELFDASYTIEIAGGLIASLIFAVGDDADYIVIVCLCFVLDVGYFIQ